MNRVVLLFFAINLMIWSVCSCPSDVCNCKWKGGKQTVECSGRFLSRLPESIDPGTQVLNFSGNSLQVLQSERFLKMDLTNLQKIYLSRNQLMRIHDKSFRGLSNLIELDLSDNMLTTVPSETFQDYPSLMRLSLSGNPIRELRKNSFRYLSYLTTLELSNCQIDTIEDEAFIGMDNLEWLRLDGNRITTIKGNNILPKSLHGINLQANRWNCDCRLVNMHAWLINYNVPQAEEPKCMQPTRLAGQTIKYLIADELACMPDITPNMLYLEIAEGRNISLSCKINAIPQATVLWLFQGQMLQNDTLLPPNLHFYYFIEEGPELKRSELLIYNTNTENNGTFSCVAENSAGRTQANYTIRVLVKEDPIVEEVVFPYEYFLIIVVGACVIALILIVTCCCLIINCGRRKTHKKLCPKENTKDSSTQLQSNLTKCSSVISESNGGMVGIKRNGSLSGQQHDAMTFALLNPSHNTNTTNSLPVVSSNQYFYGTTLKNFSEQNPDLINDAESGQGRLKIDIDDVHSDQGSVGPSSLKGVRTGCDSIFLPNKVRSPPQIYSQIKGNKITVGMPSEVHQHQVDVHLNPGCFLGQSGHPMDYRLQTMVPHIISQPTKLSNNLYRTLPHSRAAKMQSASKPGIRFSMEAEFLARNATPTFDAYNNSNDLRYTVGGYPCGGTGSIHPQPIMEIVDSNRFPSPPDGYKGELSLPSVGLINSSICHGQVIQQWPICLPGYNTQLIASNSNGSSNEQSILYNKKNASPSIAPISKRCISAPTTDTETILEQRRGEEKGAEEPKLRHLNGPLADSPDEGYVGDSQDGSDM